METSKTTTENDGYDQIWAAVKSATAAGTKPKQTTEKENAYGHGEE